jgi:hypothetical protein
MAHAYNASYSGGSPWGIVLKTISKITFRKRLAEWLKLYALSFSLRNTHTHTHTHTHRYLNKEGK